MKICSSSGPGDMKKKEQVSQDMFVIFDFQINWRRCPLLDNVFAPLEAIFTLSCLCNAGNCASNDTINFQINIHPHFPKVISIACLWANLYELDVNCMHNASLVKLHKRKTQALIFSYTSSSLQHLKHQLSWNTQLLIRRKKIEITSRSQELIYTLFQSQNLRKSLRGRTSLLLSFSKHIVQRLNQIPRRKKKEIKRWRC